MTLTWVNLQTSNLQFLAAVLHQNSYNSLVMTQLDCRLHLTSVTYLENPSSLHDFSHSTGPLLLHMSRNRPSQESRCSNRIHPWDSTPQHRISTGWHWTKSWLTHRNVDITTQLTNSHNWGHRNIQFLAFTVFSTGNKTYPHSFLLG